MMIKTPNGSTIRGGIGDLPSTGFIAEEVTLNGDDWYWMAQKMEKDPEGFNLWMMQMCARFPENRVGGKNTPVPDFPNEC